MSEPISVLIVDDHAVVRRGIRALLEAEEGFVVVGDVGSGGEAVLLAADLAPDVVLMDLVMPEMDGVKATRLLKQRSPCSQVIVLTSYHEDEHIFPAIRAGALSYLLKSSTLDELIESIRKAARGEAVLHPHVAARLVQELRATPQELASAPYPLERARARGAAPHRRWPHQRGNRRAARHQREDRQEPCQQYLEQAAGHRPDAGGGICLA